MNRFAHWVATRISTDRATPRKDSQDWTRRLRAALLAVPLLAVFAATSAYAIDAPLPANVISDIQQIAVEKASRTPAQKKIDSQLLQSIRIATGNTAMYGTVPLAASVTPDTTGRIAVDIRVPVDASTLALVTSVGGTVLGSYPLSNSIQALVPVDKVEQIAADPRVTFIKSPARPRTNRASKVVADGSAPTAAQQPLSPRLQRFQATVKSALAAYADAQGCCGAGVILNSGSQNSQGDLAHRANNARAAFAVNGAGIRIGVLSDSFDNLGGAAADVASGDLPGPGNPDGFLTPVKLIGSGDCLVAGCQDEGRAMLQIVHDLAPGAILYYATAFNSDTDFANNIRALGGLAVSAPPNGIATPKCDIIIDDVSYSQESGLHDGQPAPSAANIAGITQAVNDVAAVGVLYFSSAANSGNKVDGTSGTWEGDFVDGGTTLPPPVGGLGETGNVHIWSGSAVLNPLTVGTNDIVINWSDPIGNTCNDYDIFLLNAAGTALVPGAFSANTQDCSAGQDPYEEIFTGANFPVGANIVVVLFSGAPRFLSMTTQRGQTLYNTTGATRGHNAAATGFSVAATPAAASFGPPAPNGPYPGPFVSSNQIEEFSSDGPRQSFFNAAGAAITPGNFLHTGGIIRQKPDFTAADGVSTTLPGSTGLNPFYGTSAAAPHAGAIAALVKQAAPSATNAQITTYLTSTALDIMAAGSDAGSGVGILQAFQAVSAAKAGVGIAAFDPGTITVTRVPSAGPLFPGDSATILIQLINNGAAAATGVSAVLTTSTPCITITGNTSAYPNTAVGASNTNTTPFTFSLSPACVCPVTINFTLTVTFAGGTSVINFSYVTGPAPVVINADFNSTPVVPSGYGYSTGTQSTRLSRNFAGTCAAPKAFPGTAGGAATRRYDAYTFTTGSVSPSYCINVTLDHPGFGATFQTQSGAYIGAFNPANLATNYVDDTGPSFSTASYSFTVPASTLVTITVNEVFANAGSDPYTLTISGLCGLAFAPDLAMTKTAPATVVAGTNLTYSFSVTNNGGDAANVSLTDALPAGTTFVSFTSQAGWANTTPAVGGTGTVTSTNALLPAGATANFTLVVHVNASVANATVLSNTAVAATTGADSNLANNSATATTTVNASADLSIVKTGPALVVVNTDATYNITITNNGPSDAQNVVLSDPAPANTTFVSLVQNSGPASGGPLPAGAVQTFTLVVHVNPAAPVGAIITNTANVTSTTADPNPANNASVVTSTITSPDLALTKTGPATAVAGTTITYNISVNNLGGASATSLSLTDAIPAGTTFVSFTAPGGWANTTPPVGGTGTVTSTNPLLAAASTANFTLVVAVGASVASGATVTNTASVAATSADPNLANNTATVVTSVSTSADVSITKSGPPNASPGSNATYNITVTNVGPSNAQAVVMTDPLPAGTTFVSELQNTGPAFVCVNPAVGANGTVSCSIATLAAGATATFTIVAKLSGSAAVGSVISNTAAVASATGDPTPANGSSNAGTVVGLPGGLQPVPALSEWMLALLALLLVSAAGYAVRRRLG